MSASCSSDNEMEVMETDSTRTVSSTIPQHATTRTTVQVRTHTIVIATVNLLQLGALVPVRLTQLTWKSAYH